MLLLLSKSLHWALYVAASAGCVLILAAGRREARGDLDGARRTARSGGFMMMAAAAATVATGPVVVALLPEPVRQALLGDATAVVLLAAAMMLTVLGGFVGLLAGLTGKPRPSGYFATLLLLLGVVAMVLAGLP